AARRARHGRAVPPRRLDHGDGRRGGDRERRPAARPRQPRRAARLPRTRSLIMQLVAAEDLHVYYGASHVLHGVSLSIEAGEAVGLLGRNGMGKTTLIRTLIGQLSGTRGTVRVRGIGCRGTPPHVIAREGIGYVPEGRGIFPNLSVRENLVMA